MTSLPKPIDLLPHRAPFLFVDEILELVPGVSARTSWTLTGDEWFFAGHFPGRPTLPGVLMCESIAQTGAVAILADEKHEVAKAYKVWKKKSMYGREYMGIERSAFLIDGNGKILHAWYKISP
ncbi:MAG: redoxin domain-containing protein, partial [Actinomycetota bacterium]